MNQTCRVRLTFVSEFDWSNSELTQDDLNEIMEQFMENPESFIAPADDDEQTFISVQDITDGEED